MSNTEKPMDSTENTRYSPIEPTKPVTPNYSGSDVPLSHPYSSTGYPDNPYIIAPPPPKKSHKHSFFLVAILVVAIMLFGASLFFYLTGTHQASVARTAPTAVPTIAPTPKPTATPTVQPYTAQDIVTQMIAHNLTVGNLSYGVSLASVFTDAIYTNTVTTPFQSSAVWNVDPFHTEDCNYCTGLWVYSSTDIAALVTDQLNAEGKQAQQMATSRALYPNMLHYGRCAAQGVQGTTYEAIIKQYCI